MLSLTTTILLKKSQPFRDQTDPGSAGRVIPCNRCSRDLWSGILLSFFFPMLTRRAWLRSRMNRRSKMDGGAVACPLGGGLAAGYRGLTIMQPLNFPSQWMV